MAQSDGIPIFTLLGETAHFPDVVHVETLSKRAPDHGWKIPAHRHAQVAQVFLIRRGQMKAVIDGWETDLTDGMFLHVPAQNVHEFVFQPGTDGLVFSLPVSVLHTVGPTSSEITDILSRPVVAQLTAQMDALASLLVEASQGLGRFRAQRAVGLAHSLLALIAEQAGETDRGPARPGAGDARLQALDRLIAEKMGEGWGPSDYAAALSLTLGHLSRLCRSAKGMGTTAYIEQTLMEEACRMLAFTQLSVSEIGYRLGYADPSYFSKRFRAVRRQTPSDYRARFAG